MIKHLTNQIFKNIIKNHLRWLGILAVRLDLGLIASLSRSNCRASHNCIFYGPHTINSAPQPISENLTKSLLSSLSSGSHTMKRYQPAIIGHGHTYLKARVLKYLASRKYENQRVSHIRWPKKIIIRLIFWWQFRIQLASGGKGSFTRYLLWGLNISKMKIDN